jgi:Holliday junction DNA helicase RuvA
MIQKLTGTVGHVGARSVVVEVGGVGYEVNLPDSGLAIAQPGMHISYWTYLAVRENSMELFGFETHQELEFFNMLLDVSGIGPRGALGIISIASINTLKKAIANQDTSYLTKVSGIGKKTAQKIVVELADKLALHSSDDGDLQTESETLEALQALGYSLQQSREALQQVPSDVVGTNDRLKHALQVINSHQ